MVINADGPETRVALIEKGQLAELYIERRRERGIVGNIYKGRVKRVLPGMQAAFVDIGVDKAAFLYVADVRGAPEDFKSLFMDSDEDAKEDHKSRERRSARDRGPGEGRPGDHDPGGQGADRHQGRALDGVRVAAGAQPGVHADRQPRRHLAAHRDGQGAQAAARHHRIHAAGGRRASSCAPSPRACRRRSSRPTWSSSSSCGTRSSPSRSRSRRRRCSTAISICCCARCAICSRREVDKLIVDNKSRVRAPA